ncbi:DNA polymerase family A [Babesia microti strain RI]|uniref:DNA-directed DNA polymerase n=1 Tax=Babesia microti (strain RI) TaxID=1133968 RepID=I7IS99_BABMR|nr:DNA polymerase family A [Babesia microti strain RI]CCF75466.1 DNA polymerase family A [Babesia microti strain RI]|eukprot:XP_012649874.1 DNA polymerase family A [Babesia microti strain RI]
MGFLYHRYSCRCIYQHKITRIHTFYFNKRHYSINETQTDQYDSESQISDDSNRFFDSFSSFNPSNRITIAISPLYDSKADRRATCFMKPAAYGLNVTYHSSNGLINDLENRNNEDNFHFIYSKYLDNKFNDILRLDNVLWVSHGCKGLLNSLYNLGLNRPKISQLFDTLTISNLVQLVQRETCLQKTFIEARRNLRRLISTDNSMHISADDKLFLDYELPPEIDDLFLGRFGRYGWGHYHYTKKEGVTYEPLNELKRQQLQQEDKLPNVSKKRKFNMLTYADIRLFTEKRTNATYFLYKLLHKKLELLPNSKNIWEKLERPLLKIFSQMERRGVFIDSEKVKILQDGLPNPDDIANEIFNITGYKLNLKSSKQVANMIYDILMFPCPYKTHELEMNESKFRSTSNTTLNMIIKDITDRNVIDRLGNIEVLKKLIEYRKAVKAHRVYAESLPSYKSNETDRVHCTFNQTGTVTGRISCSNPNLQNIHKNFKKIINAKHIPSNDTYQIVTFDYNKMELFILAYLSLDSILLSSVQSHDVFIATAALIFEINENEVTPHQRQIAKTITYGIIYGQSKLGLSRTLQVDVAYAGDLINKFFSTYPRVLDFMTLQKTLVRRYGESQTLAGRLRIVPTSTVNKNSVAMNTPIQGCAADVMKFAIQLVEQSLVTQNVPIDASLVLQVHDELVYECNVHDIPRLVSIVKPTMETSFYHLIKGLQLEERYMHTLRQFVECELTFDEIAKMVNNFRIPVSHKAGMDYL